MANTYEEVGNRTLYQGTSSTRYTSTYDPVNRETTLTFGSKVHAAQYDAVGQALTETYSSGTEVRRGYDSRGYMTTLIQDHNSGPTSTIISTYDAAGRKTLSVRDGVATTNTYDNDDRLTLQNRPSFVASYAYDQDTNLTSSHHQGSNPITFTNNSLGQVVTSIQGSTVTTNTWDNAGRNTVQNVGGTITNRTWDQEDRLVQQELVGSESLHEFLYRYDNLRVQSEFGEVTTDQYIWDAGGVRRIIGSEGNDLAVFSGQIVEGSDREFLSDELGHITAWAIDEAASLTFIEYWPYGDVQSGTLPQEGLGYMGAYSVTRKPFSDLLYAQQRWLKPSTGRFLSVDPYWPGELAYMYAWGIPTTALDYDGTCSRLDWLSPICSPYRVFECLVLCGASGGLYVGCVKFPFSCRNSCLCLGGSGTPLIRPPSSRRQTGPKTSPPPTRPAPPRPPRVPPLLKSDPECYAATMFALSRCQYGHPDCLANVRFQCQTYAGAISWECGVACVSAGTAFCLGFGLP